MAQNWFTSRFPGLRARNTGGGNPNPATNSPSPEPAPDSQDADEYDDLDYSWWRALIPRPTIPATKSYIKELFPIRNWILSYNWQWFKGDVIAGVTVGGVVIPQSMGYAVMADLPPQNGLYTSFTGFFIYMFFATSKDITMGTVSPLSILVGIIIADLHIPDTAEGRDQKIAIGSTLALLPGAIVFLIGLLRIGRIVDWIPYTTVRAFVTGSAMVSIISQLPSLLGVPDIEKSDPGYKIFIATLRGLHKARWKDAVIGVTALVLLTVIAQTCSYFINKATKREQPGKQSLWFFLSTLRFIVTIGSYILVGYLCCSGLDFADKDWEKKAPFAVNGHIPRGFNVAAPAVTTDTIRATAKYWAPIVIIMVLEHISIAKNFGRINNYDINASQELLAVGLTNMIGPFFGAYPATGSFSRTSIKAKAGVRSPFAGFYTAICVIFAVYFLNDVFKYTPKAALAAIIIHAVLPLIIKPSDLVAEFKASPAEVLFVFFPGLLVTIFVNIPAGIYTGIGSSILLLGYSISRTKGHLIGRSNIYNAIDENATPSGNQERDDDTPQTPSNHPSISSAPSTDRVHFAPLDGFDRHDPKVKVATLAPGILAYRFSERFIWANCALSCQDIVDNAFKLCSRTTPNLYRSKGDRPWNDPAPRRGQAEPERSDLPLLRAIILDFEAVYNMDLTALQNLVDIQQQLDRFAQPHHVRWHFANVVNPDVRKMLARRGFGQLPENTPASQTGHVLAELWDEEKGMAVNVQSISVEGAEPRNVQVGVPLYGKKRPLFHVDVRTALDYEMGLEGPKREAEGEDAASTKEETSVGVVPTQSHSSSQLE